MTTWIVYFLKIVSVFFLIYLIFYASYLFLSVVSGAWKLYYQDKMRRVKNELKHDFYFPVSILVPCYNEEVTILDSIESLLELNYRLYEIIVVDDGSTDDTAQKVIEYFHMKKVDRPIRKVIPCQDINAIYESDDLNVKLTLICKKNGGKGDALNMGINASRYPYYLCIDADSLLQKDSLERIVQPVLENDDVIAVGGLVRASQGVEIENGEVKKYHLSWNPVVAMQVVEYDRSFLASRILLDSFNGNLIISGAFGLFRKDIVVAVGGYDTSTLGEDMELVVKMHMFCINNQVSYRIRYEPSAVCWSQVPESLIDLSKQRRRWHLGLFQCMKKYKSMFMKSRFGFIGSISYLYYLFYELLSPLVELFGLIVTLVAYVVGLLDFSFMIKFFILYVVYGSILTITAFIQRIYTQNLKVGWIDFIKACIICLMESLFFRYFLVFVRLTAFIGYKKNKQKWGKLKRSEYKKSTS